MGFVMTLLIYYIIGIAISAVAIFLWITLVDGRKYLWWTNEEKVIFVVVQFVWPLIWFAIIVDAFWDRVDNVIISLKSRR